MDTLADEAPDTKPSENPNGVFGNLPGTRPGARSPRRRAQDGDGAGDAPAAPERRAAPPPPPPTEPDPPLGTEREGPVPTGPAAGPKITSVEDLAWAGIAVAAEAATIGVRFASRAVEAARKSVDRDS
jgi:hypothetical protein